MHSFGAPVQWKPLVIFGLVFLWATTVREVGIVAASTVTVIAAVLVLYGGSLRNWYRRRRHGEHRQV